jgi:hypothetical protein
VNCRIAGFHIAGLENGEDRENGAWHQFENLQSGNVKFGNMKS